MFNAKCDDQVLGEELLWYLKTPTLRYCEIVAIGSRGAQDLLPIVPCHHGLVDVEVGLVNQAVHNGLNQLWWILFSQLG